MEIDPQVEAASGKQSTAAKLVVRLKDGREITAFVSAPKGSQSRSFTRDEHHSRFKQELMTRISGSACAEIIAAASDLEQLDASWLGRKRSEEHTSELQSLMRISYAVFCLKKKTTKYFQFNTQC